MASQKPKLPLTQVQTASHYIAEGWRFEQRDNGWVAIHHDGRYTFCATLADVITTIPNVPSVTPINKPNEFVEKYRQLADDTKRDNDWFVEKYRQLADDTRKEVGRIIREAPTSSRIIQAHSEALTNTISAMTGRQNHWLLAAGITESCEWCTKRFTYRKPGAKVCCDECGMKLGQLLVAEPQIQKMTGDGRYVIIQAYRDLDGSSA